MIINDHPEKVEFLKPYKGILIGILFMLMGLHYSLLFNSSFDPFSVLFLGFGLFILINSIFEIKQYHDNKLYLTIKAVIIIFMLILTYIQTSLSQIKWWL